MNFIDIKMHGTTVKKVPKNFVLRYSSKFKVYHTEIRMTGQRGRVSAGLE